VIVNVIVTVAVTVTVTVIIIVSCEQLEMAGGTYMFLLLSVRDVRCKIDVTGCFAAGLNERWSGICGEIGSPMSRPIMTINCNTQSKV
jgi:hypothetical protein